MYNELKGNKTAENESEILKYWKEIDILKRSIDTRDGHENFVFFEGPPTANGKPGIHHVLARTLKDSVLKYKTMQGYRITRKAGWDTHGLPVEIEVEKTLGFNGKQDIEKYGIKEFNDKCRDSVFTYEAMWRELTERMGYFIDLDDPYITLDNKYIETEWWILKKLFDEGMMYEGHKILPYCPRCGTGLASHEVAQGYQMIKTDTVYVRFKVKDKDEYFLAWTTTPWTLASNVALTVGPDIEYVKVKNNGYIYYLAKSRLSVLDGDYEILDEMTGKDLEYIEYEQLMPFVKANKKAFYVTCANYVTTEDGTGIVHTAPAFGEDDYDTGMRYDLPVLNPVDESGKYTQTPWVGMFVMEADKEIIPWLKENGKLYKKQKIEHNYPHCWRCKTPLLYYAKPSWYVRTTAIKKELIDANNAVNWYPSFVGEKRFGNWLENNKDWAISRNRYWGTPLNIWRCSCGHCESIGGIEELIEKAEEKIDNTIELHRPYVDEIHIKCPECGNDMTRVKDVIDCWFDSGSMPYAQRHYPFENQELFEEQFPADFICEGIDQTRGWFYSLLVLGTFLKGKAPYKNVLVNDLVLDANGQKMSKSRGNTVNPFELFDKYGADALRWYLLYVSPAWTPTKFDENGLKEIISKFFNTYKNVYTFFSLYANTDNIDVKEFDIPVHQREEIDRWLISKYNSLVKETIAAMEEYDMTKAVRAIQDFVNEDLSNWYIRRNRKRFWGSDITDDKKMVYLTTYEVLCGISKLAAPFAPFITEEIYKDLTGEESVHLTEYPRCNDTLIDKDLEIKMDTVRSLVSLGRSAREEVQIKVRQPISGVHIDSKLEPIIGELTSLIKEELNVKEVIYEQDLSSFLDFTIKPNFKVCGKILGSNVKLLDSYLKGCDAENIIKTVQNDGSICIELNNEQISITEEMLDIRISAKEGFDVQTQDNLFIVINTELTPKLISEGFARELISKVQQTRKNCDYDVADRIKLLISTDETIERSINEFSDFIKAETLSTSIAFSENDGEEIDLNGHIAKIKTIRQ